jgi:uncharacterized protein (TIGR03086 family)
MSESTERLTAMMNDFDARVQAAPADAWTNASPCNDWTARDVVVHVANNYLNVAAGLTGGQAEPIGDDEDITAAWARARDGITHALATGDLTVNLPTPMGPMPADMFIGRFVAMDTLVHTWDLARAVNGDEHLNQDAVAHGYEGLKPMDAMLRMPGVFGPKVPSAEGADLQTEFLNFLGRTV